jgi:hypothetical protein
MLPAQQCLKAGDLFRARMHHRLIGQPQPAMDQRIAQVGSSWRRSSASE